MHSAHNETSCKLGDNLWRVCTWLIRRDKVYLPLTIWTVCRWLNDLFRKGNKGPLELTDTYKVFPQDQSSLLGDEFGKQWQTGTKRQTLLRTLWSIFGCRFLLVGLIKFFEECVSKWDEITVCLHLCVRAVLCVPDELTHCYFISCFLWTIDNDSRLTWT